jgi:hypothetical protein
LKLGNQELLNQGTEDTFRFLSFVDSDGIFSIYANRDVMAWGYYTDFHVGLSILTDLFKTAEFDFLNYRAPHGKTVKELFDMNHTDLMTDIHVIDHYMKINTRGGWKEIKNLTHEEFLQHEEVTGTYFSPMTMKDGHLMFYTFSPEYVSRYRPDIPQSRFATFESSVSNFYYVLPWALHQANN